MRTSWYDLASRAMTRFRDAHRPPSAPYRAARDIALRARRREERRLLGRAPPGGRSAAGMSFRGRDEDTVEHW